MIHKNIAGRGIHQPGQYQVQNETGSAIPKGTVVQIVGFSSFISVAPVDNQLTNNILGVAVDEIDADETGYVARMGLFGQFDTSLFALNSILYSDGSGNLTTTASGPQIGLVLAVSPSNGQIHMDVRDVTSGGGSGGHTTIITTLTQTDIDNGYINLPATPSSAAETIVMLEGAPAQTYGDDFNVVGNQLNFITTNPEDLGNILTASDKLTIMYK
jgi:predicted RecA/RadA family phage recombinase